MLPTLKEKYDYKKTLKALFSPPRKTAPEKLKTILRMPVRAKTRK